MAVTQKDVLVAVQRAEFDAASKLDRIQFRLQVAAVAVAMLGLFSKNNKVEVACGVLAVGLTLGTFLTIYLSRKKRSLGEKARRATLLVDGLGIRLVSQELLRISSSSTIPPQELAKWNDPEYFTTTEAPGVVRAMEMLEESAFWTSCLYKASARKLLVQVLLFAIPFVLAILLTLGLVGDMETVKVEVRLICTLASTFIWLELIQRTLAFNEGGQAVNEVLSRIESLRKQGCQRDDFFLLLLDYNSAVEGTPLIAHGVYDKNRDRIQTLWSSRLQ